MIQVRSTAAQTIPVIDISPLRDGSKPTAVAQALLAASRDLGFIYINGHGIPDEVITTARGCALDFFLGAEQEKRRYTVSDKHRGWLSQGGAKMQDDLAADLKESFIWGYQDDAGDTPCDHDLRGPNQWPDFVPGMESAALDYFNHADRVARDLLRGFALGLNLDTDFFLRNSEVPLSRASFVYYPGQAASSDKPVLVLARIPISACSRRYVRTMLVAFRLKMQTVSGSKRRPSRAPWSSTSVICSSAGPMVRFAPPRTASLIHRPRSVCHWYWPSIQTRKP